VKNRERKCSTCKHYQPSPLWRKGWCRNPLLYDRNTNHLVEADSLACNRTFIDYWEPMTGPAPSAGPQARSPKPRIAPSIPMDTMDAAGKRVTITGNTPAGGMAAVAPKTAYTPAGDLDRVERPQLSLVKPEEVDEAFEDPNATIQIEEIEGPEAGPQTTADRIKKARKAQRSGPMGFIRNPIMLVLLVLLVLAAASGGFWFLNRDRFNQPVPKPTVTVAVVVPTPTGFGDPTATVPVQPTVAPTPLPTDRIVVGGWVQVSGTNTGLVVRETPARAGKRLGVIKEGTKAHVIEGPVDADGFQWWKLDSFDGANPPPSGRSAGQFLIPIPPP
jgi:hypothetical protein